MAKAMTANLLRSGDVVYLAGDGRWVRELAAAQIADSSEKAAAFERTAEEATARQEIVEPYLFDVEIVNGQAVARSARERIRAAHGPTVGSSIGR